MAFTQYIKQQLSHYLLALIIACAVSQTTYAQEIPLDSFLQHSDYLDIKLAPDGQHFAARLREKERIYLTMIRIADGAVVGGVNPGRYNEVREFEWVNNERLVYSFAEKRVDKDYPIRTGEIFGISTDGQQSEILAGYRAGDERTGTRISNKTDSNATFEIVSTIVDNPKQILIAEYPWEKQGRFYYDTRRPKPIVSLMDAYSGRKKKVEMIDFPGATLYASASGLINFVRYRDEDAYHNAAFRDNKDSPWLDLGETFNIDATDIDVVGINKTGDRVYLEFDDGVTGLNSIYELNLKTRSTRKLFNNKEADIQDWMVDKNGQIAIGISYPSNEHYFYDDQSDSSIGKLHKLLRNAFKNQTVSIRSISNAGTLAIVQTHSDINPGEYYLFNATTKQAQFLSANYSWLDPAKMLPKQAVRIQARDDLAINGYLTMPVLSDKTAKAPLVVLPHGGPHGVRDFPEFDWEVQLLANRGYAVLQPNFRGSSGYGYSFKTKGYRQWGGTMIEDIIDATKSILDSEQIDPSRVCIYGHSYGAYAAMMASIKAPELFKCSIGASGIYDLTQLDNDSKLKMFQGHVSYLHTTVGTDPATLREQSPIYLADSLQSEILLIHGRKDFIAPQSHYKRFSKALKSVDKKHETLLISDAGHGPYNLENRREHYSRVLKFLDTHIGNQVQ